MTYTEILKESLNIFLRNIVSIIKVFLFFTAILFVLQLVLPNPGSIYNGNEYIDDPGRIFALRNNFTGFSAVQFIERLAIGILFGVNSIAMLNLVRGQSYGIGEIISIFKENYSVLLPVAVIEAIGLYIITNLPIVGGILAIIVSLALTFLYFLIEDYPNQSPISYFVESYHRTKGHKLSLALLHAFFFIIIIFIIFIVIGSIIAIFNRSPIVSLVLILMVMLPLILTSMVMTLARAIFYEDRRNKIL